ncbi:hypothetical protein ACQY0O_001448 [Thecaphora frezii]
MLMVLLMHSNAAFTGQGVIYKIIGKYNLPNLATGGTIHIIIINQIGFTTSLHFSHLTPSLSDIAKLVNMPIFHVNSDHIETVTLVAQLAADWHAKFKKDIIIDLVCYCHHSRNEMRWGTDESD